MGKTTAQVMPPLTFWQRLRTLPDSIAFSAVDIISNFIFMVFFVGDVLMSARLIIVGIFAIIDRLRRPGARPHPVSIPAWPFSSPLQRRNRDRAHHPLRAQFGLQKPARHCHRRRLPRPYR